MKEHIAEIINKVENWNLSELERLSEELDSIIATAEDETCTDCENRPQNGACYACKMD